MFERLTDPARAVLRRAASETHDLGHGFLGTEDLLLRMLDLREGLAFQVLSLRHHHIGTEHLLLALIREGDGVAARVLRLLAPDTDFRQVVIQRLRAAS